MDVLLALLALFNVLAMITVFMPRTFPDNILPWFVFAFALLSTELAWLWLPLPVLGSAYPVARGFGITSQDISSKKYSAMIRAFGKAFEGHTPLI